jgi:hypothetical protein
MAGSPVATCAAMASTSTSAPLTCWAVATVRVVASIRAVHAVATPRATSPDSGASGDTRTRTCAPCPEVTAALKPLGSTHAASSSPARMAVLRRRPRRRPRRAPAPRRRRGRAAPLGEGGGDRPPSSSTTAARTDRASTSGSIAENRNVSPIGTTKAKRKTLRSRARSRRSLARMSRAACTSVPQRAAGEVQEDVLEVGFTHLDAGRRGARVGDGGEQGGQGRRRTLEEHRPRWHRRRRRCGPPRAAAHLAATADASPATSRRTRSSSPTRSVSSRRVPSPTIRPWSTIARRSHRRSASSM